MCSRSYYGERNLRPRHIFRSIHLSQSKTGFQQAEHSLVNVFLINLAFLSCLYQCLITGATLQIRSVQHCGCRSRLCIGICLMPVFIIKIGNSTTIGKNNTIELPIVTENLHQQTVAAATRLSLETVIGTHHLLYTGFLH